MQPLEFNEISEVLNHSRNVKISLTPAAESAGNWSQYKGEYRVHLSTMPFEVLYLNSKATAESIRDARKRAFTQGKTQVVYAASLEQRQKSLREVFRGETLYTPRQYLASFISEELNSG